MWSTIFKEHSAKTSAGLKLNEVKEHCIEQAYKYHCFLHCAVVNGSVKCDM